MIEDPYVYPGTEVLRNNYGIKDKEQLDIVENIITKAQMRGVIQEPISMDAHSYQNIHKHIFGKVYPWAGELRIVDMSKGDSFFCRAERLVPEMNKRFELIKDDNYLKNLSEKEFAQKAAEHISELNAIHPFPEGNGRTNRLFLENIARQAGHHFDQRLLDPQNWNDSSIDSFKHQDYKLLASEIEIAIVDPEKTKNFTDPVKLRHAREIEYYKTTPDKNNPVLETLRKQDRDDHDRSR